MILIDWIISYQFLTRTGAFYLSVVVCSEMIFCRHNPNSLYHLQPICPPWNTSAGCLDHVYMSKWIYWLLWLADKIFLLMTSRTGEHILDTGDSTNQDTWDPCSFLQSEHHWISTSCCNYGVSTLLPAVGMRSTANINHPQLWLLSTCHYHCVGQGSNGKR